MLVKLFTAGLCGRPAPSHKKPEGCPGGFLKKYFIIN